MVTENKDRYITKTAITIIAACIIGWVAWISCMPMSLAKEISKNTEAIATNQATSTVQYESLDDSLKGQAVMLNNIHSLLMKPQCQRGEGYK